MERSVIKGGVEIKKPNLTELLFNKTMLIAYALLAIGMLGILDVFSLRFFGGFVNAHDMIMDPGSNQVAADLRNTILGHGGEINKAEPWGLFVANYMFMLYTGSAMILLVAIAELFHLKVAPKVAAAFIAFGLAMVLAGMFTISMDWGNPINLYWMFINPQPGSGMWRMLPLYMIYIPFTIVEIYFLLTHNRDLARKVAIPIVVIGILIEIAEFVIQAGLFASNPARHLWSDDPLMALYLVLTGFTAALGIMAIFASLTLKEKDYYMDIMEVVRRSSLVAILALIGYELYAETLLHPAWVERITSGSFGALFFGGYVALGTAVPFVLFLKAKSPSFTVAASILTIIGAYINRLIFIYGGNAVPMTDRAGTGFQADKVYQVVHETAFAAPHMSEIMIAIGSIGVALLVYKLADGFFEFSKEREH